MLAMDQTPSERSLTACLTLAILPVALVVDVACWPLRMLGAAVLLVLTPSETP